MYRPLTNLSLALIAAATLSAAACGGHESASIAAPTPTPSTSPSPVPAPSSSGATISGVIAGGVSASAWMPMASGITVTVVNSSISSSVDASGRFSLRAVPSGRVELRFSGPGVDAQLELNDVGDHDTITITVRLSGSTAQIDDDAREKPGNEVEVEGLVSAVSPGTITVAGKTFAVTSATEIVQDGRTFTLADIHTLDRVHVHGTASGTTLTATKIQLKSRNAGPGPGDAGEQVELKGAIVGPLGGSCPNARTFSVAGRSVTTGPTTQFKHVACSDLKAGMEVEVKGKLASGVVQAASIEAEEAKHDDAPTIPGAAVELKGKIDAGSLGGGCTTNNLSFKVAGTLTKTNASTQFKDTQCSALKAGDSVEVKGTRQTDGSVVAARVEKK